jgi:hypothetical protein
MRQDIMPENGSSLTTRPLFVSQPCPPSAPCADATRKNVKREPYNPLRLSNSEAAELVEAKAAADGDMAAARPGIDTAVRAVLAREHESRNALHTLEVFVRSADTAHGRIAVDRVRARHEHDGAEDRRRRPKWARWALWLAVPAAGIYDTAFFTTVFLRLVDAAPDPSSVEFYIAMVPGVMITVALLAAGHWLANAFVRARAHTERDPARISLSRRLGCLIIRREPAPRTRARDDLPWPLWVLPVAFAVLVLGTLTMWADIRAASSDAEQVSVPAIAVALLLLMFSITAVVVKTVHYNPFADAARDAARELKAATRSGAAVVTTTSAAVAEFETTNRRLRGVLDDLAARANRRIDEAWSAILRDRHQHGLAGTVAPPFEEHDARAGGPFERHPLFDGLSEPTVWLGPVHEGRAMLRDDAVRHDGERLRALLAALTAQRTIPSIVDGETSHG